jgi:hypothetical protein
VDARQGGECCAAGAAASDRGEQDAGAFHGMPKVAGRLTPRGPAREELENEAWPPTGAAHALWLELAAPPEAKERLGKCAAGREKGDLVDGRARTKRPHRWRLRFIFARRGVTSTLKRMTKPQLIDVVSVKTGREKAEVEAVLESVLGAIAEALHENQRVDLRGFGSFVV